MSSIDLLLERLKEWLFRVGLLRYLKPLLVKPLYFIKKIQFRRSAFRSIEKFHHLLEKNSFSCWIEFGSFLGAYREKKIISHDLDIDFAIMDGSDVARLDTAMLEAGFQKRREIWLKHANKLVEVTYSGAGAQIDIFIAHSENGKTVTYDFESERELTWGATIEKYGGLLAFRNEMTPFNLKKIDFCGLSFLGASNEHQHLSELYGEDYMVPNPKWKLILRPIRKSAQDYGVVKYF